MTGRLRTEYYIGKNTGASGEPTVANTHTVQSLEIGYDSYNRVNRLAESGGIKDKDWTGVWRCIKDTAIGDYLMDLLSMENKDKVWLMMRWCHDAQRKL